MFGRHDPPHGDTEPVWPKQRLAELQKIANTHPQTRVQKAICFTTKPCATSWGLGGPWTAGCLCPQRPRWVVLGVTVQPLLCKRVCRVREQLTFHLARLCCKLCKIPDGHWFLYSCVAPKQICTNYDFFSTRVWPWITKLLAIAKRMLVATMPPPNPQPQMTMLLNLTQKV